MPARQARRKAIPRWQATGATVRWGIGTKTASTDVLTASDLAVGCDSNRLYLAALIHAAAGGVGHLAAQIAKARGAQVIGTTSTPKHDFVRGLGANEMIDYSRTDFAEAGPQRRRRARRDRR